MLYHVTAISNIESIRQTGLIPQIGERSIEFGESLNRIYLFTSKAFCEDALMNWLGDYFDEQEIAILEINESHVNGTSEVDYEIACEHSIPAAHIRILNESFCLIG